jgi:phenylalanyl-tRNA synthetase alpha subunit
MELEHFISKKENEIFKNQEIIKECKSFMVEYEYFKKLKTKRNAYIVAMRIYMAKKLAEKKIFTFDQIGLLLSKDHATIMYLVKTSPPDYIKKIVEENIETWINNQVYPVSVPSFESSYKGGFKHIITYKLKAI